jgi:diaminohydroxyphosphoribosylaminopyrimidine deaminase/5-amino-6-(5-phosphoribosylamino)uracil reductase
MATARDDDERDSRFMRRALAVAATARTVSPPNPWVGCVIVTDDDRVFEGATEAPGRRHAEIVALDNARVAGADVRGATAYTTLEPCSHTGRTGPCTDALIEAGIARVVSAIADPDPLVAGRGIAQLEAAGVEVTVGCLADRASDQLDAYLHHRRTGRPFVVLKTASTLDGRTAAADGSSQWITGEEARIEAHRLRAESGAIVVGAGTVRADDPSLTTRLVEGPSPRRIVLGEAPENARVRPCEEWTGPLEGLLDRLGSQGVLQVLVEGGAHVAGSFHRAGLVDRYVMYFAPALMGGDRARPVFAGLDGRSMDDMWRGKVSRVRQLGDDIEIVIEPSPSSRLRTEETL